MSLWIRPQRPLMGSAVLRVDAGIGPLSPSVYLVPLQAAITFMTVLKT